MKTLRRFLSAIPTWFWEQLPALVLLFLSLRHNGAFDPVASFGARSALFAGALGALAGIKLQSIAAREREELNAIYNIPPDHKIRCIRAKEFWSVMAQLAALAVMANKGLTDPHAVDPWGLALLARTVLYPRWRALYRLHCPLKVVR